MKFKFKEPKPTPTPTPEPSRKKEKKEEKEEGLSYLEYLAMLAANESDKDVAVKKELRAANAAVDKDTFKSEAPAKTAMSTDTMGADKFLDHVFIYTVVECGGNCNLPFISQKGLKI